MRPDPARKSELSLRRLDPGPLNADWVWQPSGWCSGLLAAGDHVGDDMRLFHDGSEDLLQCDRDDAGIVLTFDLFSGTFLSIAVDLPPQAASGLSPYHVIAADLVVARPEPLAAFLRLNLRLGPDTLSRTVGICDGPAWCGVDLDRAFAKDQQIDHAWLDIIVERPTIGPLSFGLKEIRRYPRPAM